MAFNTRRWWCFKPFLADRGVDQLENRFFKIFTKSNGLNSIERADRHQRLFYVCSIVSASSACLGNVFLKNDEEEAQTRLHNILGSVPSTTNSNRWKTTTEHWRQRFQHIRRYLLELVIQINEKKPSEICHLRTTKVSHRAKATNGFIFHLRFASVHIKRHPGQRCTHSHNASHWPFQQPHTNISCSCNFKQN